MKRPPSQRGSAIIMLFVAVALFGALAYAFMRGSSGSTAMMTGEGAKVKTAQMQDCTNTINMAMKRLQLRGCGAYISVEQDGSNPNPNAPTNGSCSVFHINGGGVKPCALATPPAEACTTAPLGAVCSDSSIYIGTVGGNRVYTTAANEAGTYTWTSGSFSTVGASSTADGLTNTNSILAAPGSPHQAAARCRSLGPQWYLPSKDELTLFFTNKLSLGIPVLTGTYWTSTEFTSGGAYALIISAGSVTDFTRNKLTPINIRCIRR